MTFSGLPSAVYSVEFPNDRRYAERAVAAPSEDRVVPYEEARRRAMLRFDREYLQELLRCCNGNVTAAAKMSGLSRTYLHRLLRRQHLRGRSPLVAAPQG